MSGRRSSDFDSGFLPAVPAGRKTAFQFSFPNSGTISRNPYRASCVFNHDQSENHDDRDNSGLGHAKRPKAAKVLFPVSALAKPDL
jgi:hypothetical protein